MQNQFHHTVSAQAIANDMFIHKFFCVTVVKLEHLESSPFGKYLF